MAGDTSGQLQLATNGSTTALTIDTSQNVGIGTTSPSYKLDVQGSVGSTISSKTAEFNAAGGSIYSSYNDGTKTWRIGAGIQSAGMLTIRNHTDSNSAVNIDSSGQVMVGTTARQGKFTVRMNVNADWATVSEVSVVSGVALAAFSYFSGYSPNNTTSFFYYAQDTTTPRFKVRANGGIENYSANDVNLSDIREKTNIELAGSYLNKICAIPVKTFNYIDQNMEEDDGLTLGVIAQDVQAVAPELIMESNWGKINEPEKLRLSIYQTDLQYALMKCIQEQQTIINDLKARVTALEAK
jgi:hypothetical protein